MPKWFTPAVAVCAVMFAVSPDLIANARTNRRWASCRRFDAPPALGVGVPAGGHRVRYRERTVSLRAIRITTASRWAAAELVVVSASSRRHRPAVGTEGVGRAVAVECAADLEPDGLDGLCRLSTAAAVRRAWVGQARGGAGAVGPANVPISSRRTTGGRSTRRRAWYPHYRRRSGCRSGSAR